jgi:hypothetical protein
MAKIAKLASIAVFPELRNGETTPERGIAPSAPPDMRSISSAIKAVRPVPRNTPYSSDARRAMEKPRRINNAKSRQTDSTPGKPHSSAMEGSTRSV